MKIAKNKTLSYAISIILIALIGASMIVLPAVNAHNSATDKSTWYWKTYAYVAANPNPVGVNQRVLIVMWLDKVFDPGATLTNDWRFHNYQLTITKPDGTTEQQSWSVVQDTTSAQTYSYVPDQVGTYKLFFSFPGQNYNDYGHGNTSLLLGDVFLASNATTTLTVQQDPLSEPITSYPLPHDYWTRPIYGDNTDWYAIASNWLGTGSPPMSSIGSGTAGSGGIGAYTGSAQLNRYPGDAVGSLTPHIMWTKPLQAGGIVGGTVNPIPATAYFEGSAYNQRYTNPIIIDGILYYTEPVSFTGASAGPTDAVDLRTGQVIWSRSDVPSLSFGYVYDVEDPNQHGVFPPILFTSNFARAFDADTGDQMFNVTNVPSGMTALGPQGEHLRYVIANAGTTLNPSWYLAEWNSSKLWYYTGLSPALYNASNGASWSIPAGFGGNMINSFTVDGGVADPTNTQYRYDWNVSLPWRNAMTTNQIGNTSVLAVFYNNMMLLKTGAYPILSDFSTAGGVVTSTAPYTYFAVNLNKTRGNIGDVMWTKTYNAPEGNVTITFGGADPTVGVFVEGIKETMQFQAYSLTTGDKLWGPIGNQSSWDYFGNPIYDYATSCVAYGKLYSSGYGGIEYAYDLKTGNLVWTYGNGGQGNSTRSEFYTPYGGYPTFINAVGNGILYLVTAEHTPQIPLYKGALERAINATDGTELWTISGYTGEFSAMSYAIADGYSNWFNGYDNQIYTVGRGPSATTVSAPNFGLSFGTPVIISGTVMDISAGSKQSAVSANFANGLPVASDASMKDWMGYVYQQKPLPTSFIGVSVTIDVLDSNGNYRPIGTAKTDANGKYSIAWTPDISGNYTVVANFAGTNGYFPSDSSTTFTVMNAEATPAPTAISSQASMTDTYVLASAIAIIVAIAIVGAVLALLVRKRP